MVLDNSVAHVPSSKCNLFAQHFPSVFTHAYIDMPSFNFGWNKSLSRLEVSATDVQKKLETLDSNKSAGPDDGSASILKFYAPVLTVHLTFFNRLLAAGIFLACLKVISCPSI